ncbi:hypothetical protein LB534_00085 [Mesorhizobium sp. CA18]|uniref:hypothetical protein n=1 Tax=unclassified Mesorhizobium TaxID=325217 RepID=UPI001CCB7877|nr:MULTISPECIES: hypothetical protein [unclassified Mesorhizobium]MBZ9732233.1 hypothetical protein [Mesorhizobium sp. CA9]MBZ9823671.1 hypothetical protein [Mesorhizobium sp. CA18]MBZ9829899.1 hypothetical protein [Mesorhizobium sp. CA2]MBZ9836003.1 hypothetical protein [Mesorhizobium sp. CA3]MBZ9875313.1 hypothetical protein [Mesorhizobium sp. Ca11]
MNRSLVNTLSAINAILAVAIILIFALGGGVLLGNSGGLIGLALGFIVASVLCGGLAALCLIEKHLRVLADDLKRRQKAAPATRTEPPVR